MSKSIHNHLSAAERWERRGDRRPTARVRRQSTRTAVVLAAILEG